MIDNFLAYIERLELLTFFSGYPLVYTFGHFIARSKQGQRIQFSSTLLRSLPLAYALTGSIFFLLWIREIVIQLSIENIYPGFNITALKVWGLLAGVFWIPVLARRPVYSFLHSLVFFVLFCKDLVTGISSPSGKEIISNDMKVYTISLALNILCLITIFMASWIFPKMFPPR
jgi:hypothetical protein